MSGKDELGPRGSGRRLDRMIGEERNDPYLKRYKPDGNAVCKECGVTFEDGRWQWSTQAPENANQVLCPACERIRDRVPAGYLTLNGDFFREHWEEILGLVHNKVEGQKAQHPMKRLMDEEQQDDGSLLLTFTDVHLPQGVGKDLEKAYEGKLEVNFADAGDNMRVYWER